jgi:rhomboid family protein
MSNPYSTGAIPTVIKNLLIINVLFFLAKSVLPSQGIDIDALFALHHPQSQLYRPWQILTHFFMHGNFMHIAFNMFGIWLFGRMLEAVWGGKRFLFFYIITAFSAALLHFLVVQYQIDKLIAVMDFEMIQEVKNNGYAVLRNNQIYVNEPLANQLNILLNGGVVGASGALFGILGACFILFPNTQLMLLFPPIPIRLKYFVTFYGLYELYRGLQNAPGDYVAHFAHLGGLIAGIIIVKYWNRTRRSSLY